MRGAPHHAGPRTTFAQVTGGGEVGKVGVNPQITLDEVGSLPVALDPVTAGRMLGLGRTTTYRLLRQGAFPVPAHRAGKAWVVPTAGILAYLGLDLPRTHCCGCGCGARSDHTKGEAVDGFS